MSQMSCSSSTTRTVLVGWTCPTALEYARGGCRRKRHPRQLDADGRPLALARGDLDGPAVRLHDLTRDEQAEAQPLGLLALLRAAERLEHDRQHLGGDRA